jgi:hypothetical protein
LPLPLTLTRRDRTLFFTRLRRLRERLRWARHRLNAAPPAIRIVVLAATVLAVFSVANVVYQLVRKPTEIFLPVSATMNKSPAGARQQRRRDPPMALAGRNSGSQIVNEAAPEIAMPGSKRSISRR